MERQSTNSVAPGATGSEPRVPPTRPSILGLRQDLLLGSGAVLLFAVALFLLLTWKTEVLPLASQVLEGPSLPSFEPAPVADAGDQAQLPRPEPVVFGSLVLSRNDVQHRSADALHWRGVRDGHRLFENDMLQTGDRSLAIAQAREGWRLSLGERSLVRLERREQNRIAGFNVPLAVLLSGQMEGELRNASTAPVMVVKLADGVLSVRSPRGGSARYFIQTHADSSVSASIFSGTAEYRRGERTVTLRAQQGLTVSADGGELSVIDLPPAPRLVAPARGAMLATGGSRQAVLFEWQRVERASSYRLQVARDASFRESVVDTLTSDTRYEVPELTTGRHYWRVRSLAGVVQGEPAPASVFRVSAYEEPPQALLAPVAEPEVAPEVVAPRQTAAQRLVVEFDRRDAPADGQSAIRATVRVLDAEGQQTNQAMYVSVEASGGRLQLPGRPTDETRVGRGDLDRLMPGIQVPLAGGVGRFSLLAPYEPEEVEVRVTVGNHEARALVSFVAERRPMLATGFVEGNAALRSKPTGDGRSSDFERELGRASGSFNGGKGSYGASSQVFLKGDVGRGYLLTLAYDSERAAESRFFRDIRPEEFYPIRGDASIQGFDARSSEPLYLRLDRNRSYLVYGDFVTGSTFAPQALGQYARTVTGLRHHLEGERGKLDTFLSESSARQIVEEQPARGVSGPYYVSRGNGLRNSEKVEVVTRARNQPAVILAVRPMRRFIDYTFEPFSGQIIFMAPVPSVDADFNPLTIRVTYEADEGGREFWTGGADGQLRVSDSVSVGGSFVEDRDPVRPFRLYSANTSIRLGAATTLLAEGATSEGAADQRGNAARVELRHAGEKLSLQALWGLSDTDFQNPSSSLQQGREEAMVNFRYLLRAGTSLRAELLRSEDRALGARREGLFAGIEQRLSRRFTVDAGVRQSRDEGGPVNAGAAGITNIAQGQDFTPYIVNAPGILPGAEYADFTAWHLGLKAQLNDKSRLFAEVEQDVDDSAKSRYAIGADYRIADRARLYARHEDLASTSGPFGLTGNDRSTTSTLVGLDTSYLENGQLFSELRLRDAIAGREAHAAFGLRHLWTPRHGLRLSGGFERQQAMGERNETATAVSGGVEFSQNPLWRATTRLELRRDSEYDAILSTVGYAHKINRDWSFIARNYLNWAEQRQGPSDGFLQDRLQVGFAFRQTDTNVWSALGRYERLWERDDIRFADSSRTVDILSAHASMHPSRTLWLSGRLAAKWVDEEVDGAADSFNAYLAGFRAVHDLSKRWDVGFAGQVLFEPRRSAMQYSLGPEVGFLMAENLWISLGYNVGGFEDRDLAAMEYTNGGAYLRFRFKFDEDLFGRGRQGVDPSVTPAPVRGE
jgi:hypothetical protein